MPAAGPIAGTGVPTWAATACSCSAGARRRASGPVGRCARRNAGELNDGGRPCVASWVRSVAGDVRMPRVRRPDELQQPARVQRRDVPAQDRAEHGHAQLEPLLEPRDGVHVAELAPGRGHQLLLALLHDPRAEAGGGARRRVQVELAQPRGAGVLPPGRSRARPGGCRRPAA